MLVGGKTESTLVNLGDLAQTRLEVLPWFILNATILDETCKVMFSLCVFQPAKLIHIALEVEGLRCFEGKSLHFLNLGFEDIETHPIYRVLETGILFGQSVISVAYQLIDEPCDCELRKYCVKILKYRKTYSALFP